jgi:hypothetical protein
MAERRRSGAVERCMWKMSDKIVLEPVSKSIIKKKELYAWAQTDKLVAYCHINGEQK